MSDSLHRLTPDRRLSLDGTIVAPELSARISRITVDLHEDLFNECRIVFTDPDLSLINGSKFASGTAVFIELGYVGKLKEVFDGEVVSVEPRFVRDHPPSVVVRALERLHRLALEPKTRSYVDVDSKQIVSIIAKEHGLTGDGPAGSKGHVLQPNVSDYHMLRKIAARTGNRISIDKKKLVVGPPPSLGEIECLPGEGLKRLRVKLRSTEQVPKVVVRGWDPKDKKEIVGQHVASGELADGHKDAKPYLGDRGDYFIEGILVNDTKEAETIAKSVAVRIAERFAIAHGEILGNAEVLPGKVLAMDKFGDMLDGKYRVTHARHDFDKRGYRVEFEATRVAKKSSVVKFKAPPPPPKDAAPAKKKEEAEKPVEEKPNLEASKKSAANAQTAAADAKRGAADLKKAKAALDKGDLATAKALFDSAKGMYQSIKGAVDDAKKFADKAKEIAKGSKPDLKAAYELGKSAADATVKHAENIEKAYGEVVRSVGSAIEEHKTR